MALAELKAKAGASAGALADLEEAAKTQPSSALIDEIGDVEKARGNTAKATKAYETALRNTNDTAELGSAGWFVVIMGNRSPADAGGRQAMSSLPSPATSSHDPIRAGRLAEQ